METYVPPTHTDRFPFLFVKNDSSFSRIPTNFLPLPIGSKNILKNFLVYLED